MPERESNNDNPTTTGATIAPTAPTTTATATSVRNSVTTRPTTAYSSLATTAQATIACAAVVQVTATPAPCVVGRHTADSGDLAYPTGTTRRTTGSANSTFATTTACPVLFSRSTAPSTSIALA